MRWTSSARIPARQRRSPNWLGDASGGSLRLIDPLMSTPDLSRRYFSERQGRGPLAQPMPFGTVRRLAVGVLDELRRDGYFHEAFGYECIDEGKVYGTVGSDPGGFFLRTIMRERIWPYWVDPRGPLGVFAKNMGFWTWWDADTLFDVLEVLHDLVSKPTQGWHKDFLDCGMHYSKFDRDAGQERFRRDINAVLRLGEPAYEISRHGEIVESGPVEFRGLMDTPIPAGTEHDLISQKIDAAVRLFRARGASIDDRRHAVRDLADVLEVLRPDIKESMLSADENALFQLANGFAIRHNNRKQRGDYDRDTWLRWAFYVYLATIHAVLRVRKTQQEE
jgi:hypothetical protein